MTHERALPPRTDLRTRRERVTARALPRAVDLYDRLKERVLVDVTPPADDPFYRSAGNLEAFRPGEVLDARTVEVRRFRRVIKKADAWQVKFGSTDTQDAAVSGVATVIVPRRDFKGPVRPLLSYQCAIDALGAKSDPSYTLRRGDQLELALMGLALRRGWAVVTSDYNGPQHAFGAYPLAGRFVLDGIRAALGFAPAGFDDAGTPIALWGYSGGALATLFAVEQQGAYAPELNIVGAAGGGAGVDTLSSPQLFEDGSLLSGIPFGSVIGISRGFPGVDLHAVLTPQGQAMVTATAEMTMERLFASFPFLRCSDLLTVPSVLDIPGMRAVFESWLGQATPMTPLHLYHGVRDKYLPVTDVDALVAKYRREGADVEYRRFRFGGHGTPMFRGVPGSLRFLSERFGAA